MHKKRCKFSCFPTDLKKMLGPFNKYNNTSWPARRCACPGIRAPRWTLLELSRFAIITTQRWTVQSLIRHTYVSGLLSVSTPPSKGAVIRPKQMLFPRKFTERKARRLWKTRSCYSPLWLLRVTGNCFWFLDLPPVWKGLVCSPSLHLLLVFFLVVRRLPLQLP